MHKLQYISQGNSPEEHIRNISETLHAGCRWIQLRMKNFDEAAFLQCALVAKKLCSDYNAILIINDNVNVALQSEASGVHLGLNDMSITAARKILGTDKIIGGTANKIDDIIQRSKENADYIGVGPHRYTTTKENLSPVIGREGYAVLYQKMKEHNINIPVFAIGGITWTDIPGLVKSGVYGVAVSGAISQAAKKNEIIDEFLTALNIKTQQPLYEKK